MPGARGARWARTALAVGAVRAVNATSRRLGRGEGTVMGGHVGLAIQPQLVAILSAGRPLAAVTGTNGKTTTSGLLAAALASSGSQVLVNATGSNMPAGHAAALASGRHDGPAVLEVDEGYVPGLLANSPPEALVVLNLSRDQLDRTNEVRMVAARWRQALQGAPTTVVANADDPLVAWGVGTASDVRWVAAGIRWTADAVGCPACGGAIAFVGTPSDAAGGATPIGANAGWGCACGFSRPDPDVTVRTDAAGVTWASWRGAPDACAVHLSVPGAFNRSNAVMAAEAAAVLGVDRRRSLDAMAAVPEVAGRFAVVEVAGVPTRLLLAKNPAGWTELLAMVEGDRTPLVLAINARVADGRDPSWLWDVPFQLLAGRPVVAAGERCLDLSVRLRYAGVEHETIRDTTAAVAAARRTGPTSPTASRHPVGPEVDLIGNYTAFHDLWKRARP